jgi:hypothetical protein
MLLLLSLCIHIQRNSTARIQYLKKETRKKARSVYVCTKKKSNNMPYPKKKRTSKLVFSVQIQEKKIMFLRNFFTYINKNETEEKEFSMGFFPIQCDKKEKRKCM